MSRFARMYPEDWEDRILQMDPVGFITAPTPPTKDTAMPKTKRTLTPNDQNIDRILVLQGTSLDAVMKTAVRSGWSQRKVSEFFAETYGASVSAFGARQLLAKWAR